MGTLLNTYKHMPCTTFNRIFAIIYTCAILALFYHHTLTLLHHSTTFISVVSTTSLFISDLILSFMWATTTSFCLRPILRQVYPENLEKVLRKNDFPTIEIFICTADPYKEPPINVVNMALSLMAYDYAPEKISVYVSDDGGSELTLFAFMEAAKFAEFWLPFCRDNNIMDRRPEAYFSSNHHGKLAELEIEEIKAMCECMKIRIENVVERGEICPDYITDEQQRHIVNKYRTPGFSRVNHPTIIQVLIESAKEVDNNGQSMPNLVYVSREKNKNSPHHFKAGALNSLLRVLAVMTNAPIVLTQDCDMYSNDPQTLKRVLCYISDPLARPKLGYVQFPQRYHGINKDDTYGGEVLRLFVANTVGMDGFQGPNYFGSGCFFLRRAFFGGPTSILQPEIQELRPDRVVEKPITSPPVIELAHHVAGGNYENNTKWGFQVIDCNVKVGSLSFATRVDQPFWAMFRIDAVSQTKRWAIGVLEVSFSKYTPVVFGAQCMGFVMGLCYAHWFLGHFVDSHHNILFPSSNCPFEWTLHIPKVRLFRCGSDFLLTEPVNFCRLWVTDPWFLLYVFLFLGAYGQDCYDFILFNSTYKKWWNDQRMWLIKGLSSSSFGLMEYIIKRFGIATQGFNVTSKVQDDEQTKRYDLGLMEFGIHSLMFVPFTTASIVNLITLIIGMIRLLNDSSLEKLFVQMFIAGFRVLNSWPVYEAMILRSDKGRMPTKTIVISICLASVLCGGAYIVL